VKIQKVRKETTRIDAMYEIRELGGILILKGALDYSANNTITLGESIHKISTSLQCKEQDDGTVNVHLY
jgi:hypothetical protein